MNCIGHIFDEQPQVKPSDPCHYNVPPRGSLIVGQMYGNSFALAPDGSEWVMFCDVPEWTPTGQFWHETEECFEAVPSIEELRNFTMRTNGSD